MRYDAIVLAGGRSHRLGGVRKAAIGMPGDGRTLLQRAVAAAGSAHRLVVVGPRPARPLAAGVVVAREDPPFGGPAAGVAAGLDALRQDGETTDTAPWVLVLACDMPHVADAVRALTGALQSMPTPDAGDGVIARDGDGRLQPLAAVYRRDALTAAVRERRAAATLDGAAMFGLVRALALTAVAVPAGSTDDVDTWDDAQRFGVRPPAEEPSHTEGTHPMSDHQRSEAEREAEDEILRQWAAEVAAALDVPDLDVDLKLVLGLAGRAAHAVMRPAAPLTTFVAGYAAGLAAASGTDSADAVSTAVKTTMGLCRTRAQAQTAD